MDTNTGNMFVDQVGRLNEGNAFDDLAAELVRVIAGVRETGKAGKLVYSLNIEPTDGVAKVIIEDAIKAVVPTKGRYSATFFTTDDNCLSVKDPSGQEGFDFETEGD